MNRNPEKPLDYLDDIAHSDQPAVVRLHLMTLVALMMIGVVAVRSFFPALSSLFMTNELLVFTSIVTDLFYSIVAFIGIILIFRMRKTGWVLLNFYLISKLALVTYGIVLHGIIASNREGSLDLMAVSFVNVNMFVWVLFLLIPLMVLCGQRMLRTIGLDRRDVAKTWLWSLLFTIFFYGILYHGGYL